MQRPAQEMLTSAGLLILRLGIGGYMVAHGWGKVGMLRAGAYEQFGDPIGLGPQLSLVLVVFAEFACALLVMLGLATRLAALPLVFAMGVAAFVAHAADPWTAGAGFERFMAGETQMPLSKEPAMMFFVVFLALVFTGPGRFSLDSLLWQRVRRTRGEG